MHAVHGSGTPCGGSRHNTYRAVRNQRARQSAARMAVAVWCALLAGVFPAQAQQTEEAAGSRGIIRYDARVGPFEAGTINMLFEPNGDQYELSGSVTTQGIVQRFFRWRGYFAAVGFFDKGFPYTDAYFLLEDDGENREMVLATKGETVVHSSYGESKLHESPEGSDLMSVIFLGPHCIDKPVVHDGEDTYRLELLKEGTASLRDRKPYYSGKTKRCDYGYQYKNKPRRVTIWVAQYLGRAMPVRIRVRIPVLPDGFLRLRLEEQPGTS